MLGEVRERVLVEGTCREMGAAAAALGPWGRGGKGPSTSRTPSSSSCLVSKELYFGYT